ncbi:MAG: hypothetical protein IKI95_05105 [Clostridia bacterium]|nr:hypothetical protein [Clostridia bacterium]
MKNRYDVRFYQENSSQLRIWVNDKLHEHETLKGIITAPVSAEYANSFKNDLTDAMRQLAVRWEEIPAFLDKWLKFLDENRSKEFTDGSSM